MANKTVLIIGGDGYLGWPTAMHFAINDWKVVVIDDFSKRRMEEEVGATPLFAIPTLRERLKIWNTQHTSQQIEFELCDVSVQDRHLYWVMKEFQPSVVIHYGEQPSAPYSMRGRDAAVSTMKNNVCGTLNVVHAMQRFSPDAHLVKLGTMGEYGTPDIDIEEGWLEVTHNGRSDRMLYPKKPGSLYHVSKVADSHILEFYCRAWGIRVTDLNQGVVYGATTDQTILDPGLATSFHYDAIFGTVLNRFVTQAVAGIPLTVYGNGSQTRGYLNIRDTLACVMLAAENPASPGEFRVMNQFTEQFSVSQLAIWVKSVGQQLGLDVVVENVENPRVEQYDHYYNARNSALPDLGLQPHLMSDDVLSQMIESVARAKGSIDTDVIMPDKQQYWRK